MHHLPFNRLRQELSEFLSANFPKGLPLSRTGAEIAKRKLRRLTGR